MYSSDSDSENEGGRIYVCETFKDFKDAVAVPFSLSRKTNWYRDNDYVLKLHAPCQVNYIINSDEELLNKTVLSSDGTVYALHDLLRLSGLTSYVHTNNNKISELSNDNLHDFFDKKMFRLPSPLLTHDGAEQWLVDRKKYEMRLLSTYILGMKFDDIVYENNVVTVYCSPFVYSSFGELFWPN